MERESTSQTSTPDIQLLSAAIAVSGMSVRSFARDVLLRDPRTVWRWLAGDNPMPQIVRGACDAFLANKLGNMTDAERAAHWERMNPP